MITNRQTNRILHIECSKVCWIGFDSSYFAFSPLDLSLVEVIQASLLSPLHFLHIDYRQTNRLTNGRTLVLVKSLSRLKIFSADLHELGHEKIKIKKFRN